MVIKKMISKCQSQYSEQNVADHFPARMFVVVEGDNLGGNENFEYRSIPYINELAEDGDAHPKKENYHSSIFKDRKQPHSEELEEGILTVASEEHSYNVLNNFEHVSDFSQELISPETFLSRRKLYPTFVHCRGIVDFCYRVCLNKLKRACRDWKYLCKDIPPNQLGVRCRQQCIIHYARMKTKYPPPPKLTRDKPFKSFNPLDMHRFTEPSSLEE